MEDAGNLQDALLMPSLQEFRDTLEALLQTPYPPRSLFIQASSNVALLQDLIHASFADADSHMPSHPGAGTALQDAEPPSIQDLLPRAVIVDCAHLASTQALYGRILNGLSGWGRGEWNDELGGVLNWDGRMQGYSIKQDPRTREWQLQWDYANAAESSPSKHTSSSTTRPGIIDRKDESFSAFLEGLKMVFALGVAPEEAGIGAANPSSYRKPRFVVLLNAERLSGIESIPIGQIENTLLASFMRLGELSGKPIVPILTSRSEWLTLRPSRGATEPGASLQLPSLKRQDIVHYLRHACSGELPSSSNLTSERQISLLSSLADLLHQTFEPYIGDEIADYLWLVDKLWLDWRRPVESGAVQIGDINRLVASFKDVLTKEIEALGELRPLLYEQQEEKNSRGTNCTAIEGFDQGASTSEMRMTPKKRPSNAVSIAISSHHVSPLPGFSPYTAATPSKRSRNELDSVSSLSTSSNSINNSLSLLAKYILVAAFLASSNPSKKDVTMLATQEDELALSKRRKKGGAMRKSPTKRNSTTNNSHDLDNNNNGGPIRKKDTMVPQRMLGPKPFPLERLIAITETILPVELRSLAKSQDILQEIASLTSLKLLLKTSSSASLSTYPGLLSNNHMNSITISPFDRLDNIKLKCSTMLELDFIEQLGKNIGFKVSERLWEFFG